MSNIFFVIKECQWQDTPCIISDLIRDSVIDKGISQSFKVKLPVWWLCSLNYLTIAAITTIPHNPQIEVKQLCHTSNNRGEEGAEQEQGQEHKKEKENEQEQGQELQTSLSYYPKPNSSHRPLTLYKHQGTSLLERYKRPTPAIKLTNITHIYLFLTLIINFQTVIFF